MVSTLFQRSRSDGTRMIHVMHDEPAFADVFLKFLHARSMRIQADLVDQLFNSSEKRPARILLLIAEFGKPGEPETFIPPIAQETLVEMIGTTCSRVSFFMNRSRRLGFIVGLRSHQYFHAPPVCVCMCGSQSNGAARGT
jgi:hypothetical protein